MMNDKYQLKIVIASDVDYKNLIAEIYCDDQYVALLQQEDGKDEVKVEFGTGLKAVSLDWLHNALSEAKKRLITE